MNVKRLDGNLLDFWVAKSGGLKLLPESPKAGDPYDPESGYWHPSTFHPGSDWSQGGPIVSNEWYALEDILIGWFGNGWTQLNALVHDPLKWFMRAYVASQFGDEVEDNFHVDVSPATGLLLNDPAKVAQPSQRA